MAAAISYTISHINEGSVHVTSRPLWHGVYPAATTQFTDDLSVDLTATVHVQRALVDDGVDGLILLGTCGENNSLEPEEKRAILAAAAGEVGGRVPLIAGVSELTTPRAIAFARDAEAMGVDALMLLPAMVYVPKPDELFEHFRAVAAATSLPIMLYNNPPAYRVTIGFDVLERLADVPNVAAIKESAPDPRRFTDLYNRFGERFTLMAGLDDVALEGLILGATGWVSGLTSAFPRESVALFAAVERGDLAAARAIYRWFMPLLHLDAEHDLVQSIKLAEQIMGRGSERVRMPRMPLTGARRAEVTAMVEEAARTRPALDLAAAAE
ncbi:MAG TPA: dihydrodipicolinate synthase family protein [Allosphingosinicella sp.]|nr:dihydrodipicolinate synthase family protein [Allosphingosinicella sp.]